MTRTELRLLHLLNGSMFRAGRLTIGKKSKLNADSLAGYFTVPKPEIQRMKAIYETKMLRKQLIQYVADKKSISEIPTRRWVERQEKKGLDQITIRKIALGLG